MKKQNGGQSRPARWRLPEGDFEPCPERKKRYPPPPPSPLLACILAIPSHLREGVSGLVLGVLGVWFWGLGFWGLF